MSTGKMDSCEKANYKYYPWFYAGFVLLGLFLAIVPGDYAMAASNFALAVIFDPFQPEVKFGKKPLYQKVILLGHLVVALVLIGIAI
jgi:hypothetical protein